MVATLTKPRSFPYARCRKRVALDRYWLGPWQIVNNRYLPPEGTKSLIDLRSYLQCGLPYRQDGFGLFITRNGVELGSDYVNCGTDPDAVFRGNRRRLWQSQLNLPRTLEAQTLREALWETLTIQADPTGEERCKPIVPTVAGDFELRLCGRRFFARAYHPKRLEWRPVLDMLKRQYRGHRQDSIDGVSPPQHYRKVCGYWVRKYGLPWSVFADEPDFPPSTTLTDNFNRSDGEIGANWTEDGDIDIVTNAAQHVTSGSFGIARARYNSDLSSDDHYCQINGLNVAGIGDAQPAALARYSTSVNDFYYVTVLDGSEAIQLWKVVGGAFTSLDSDSIPGSNNGVYKISCDGSAIKGYKDGSELNSTTDTAITGNLRCGIFTYKGSGTAPRIDDWEAADLAPPVKPWNYYAQMQGAHQ